MGVPDLDPSSPPPGANRFGVDPEAVPEVVFDTGKERRTKTAMQGPSLHSSGAMDHSNQREVLQRQLAEEQQALRQQRERQLAADAVMKQLLGKKCVLCSCDVYDRPACWCRHDLLHSSP